MSAKSIRKQSTSRTNWTKLHSKDDSNISYEDSPETTKEFWKDAKVHMPVHKQPISLRLDEDIIIYFKKQGPGYQSKMNAVLKAYIKSHK
jgi:uncharacterized protein (DUF4415 family)